MMISYRSGEVGQFFMNYVAGYEKSRTLRDMFESLFDYCFPTDYKDRLRAKLSNATQGKLRIRDFIRDIEKLAARFPDVNERAIIQASWNGMHQDIRLRLIEWGVSAENIPLKKIIRKAMDIEASNETYQRELRYSKSNPPPIASGDALQIVRVVPRNGSPPGMTTSLNPRVRRIRFV